MRCPLNVSGKWFVLVVLLAAGECGGVGNLPRTVPARGVVTLDGKPVDAAQVVLVPDPPSPGSVGGFGASDSGGHFSLRAFEQKDGVIPGAYKVQVSKTVQAKQQGPAPSS